MMLKAIVFDFGQTLVDSAAGFRKAEKEAETRICQDLGLESWTQFLANYREFRKDFHEHSNFSRKALWKAVYLHYNRAPDPGFLSDTERNYWETVKSETTPFPETTAVLEQLVSQHRLGLITNTQAQATLEKHRLSLFPELERFFEVIIVAGEAGVPAKPSREPFLLCLQKLDIAPDEAVYVGDDWRIDILGAEAVGIQPIWLQHHSVSRKWPPVETSVPIITSLEGLLDMR
jgi:putative hydrolase of the HAD superfamily